MEKNSKNKDLSAEVHLHRNRAVRGAFAVSGFVLVGIGVLGMFLPLLPTTIFFILAAWCFARSSEKFHHWLHNNRYFGRYLNDYRSGKGMSLGSKIISLTLLWAGIAASGLFFTTNLYVRILLAIIAIGVTWHLLAIKTAEKNS